MDRRHEVRQTRCVKSHFTATTRESSADTVLNVDEPLIHHEMKHLHVIHPLQDFKSIPYPPSPKDVERLVDGLAPAFMKSLDVVIDSIRRGGGDKNGGWNLLLTL